MINIGIGTAGLAAFLGYVVVFLGILILMAVMGFMGAMMKKNNAAPQTAVPVREVVDLGSMTAPDGVDPMKVAALAAVIAEMEREV